MTIEGRPNINHDWESEFKQQRKQRLGDSILEYLDDKDCDARSTYEDILDEVQSAITYHKNMMDKAVQLQSLLLGHRPVDLSSPEFLTEDSWNNFPNDNGDHITFTVS